MGTGLDVVDMGRFNSVEEGVWAEDVVDAAGTVGAPPSEVGLGGVVDVCN